MSTPTVGLVGSRVIDKGLQAEQKKTHIALVFPSQSRTAVQLTSPPEGSTSYKGPKTGDSYADGVEDTSLLQLLFLLFASLVGTYCLKYVLA
mmetsp:Transcript_16231/g.32625  ORF Transcript_16231/g.32625 Transcript_16231/m.32625 type:complete len:92 (+) Transcript_16231:74-349(+)